MSNSIFLLIIEDDPDDLSFLTQCLNEIDSDLQIKSVSTLSSALLEISNKKFDLIITDLFLSDSQGIATFLSLQKETAAPVIIVGGTNNDTIAETAIRLGAQDFIPKTEVKASLLERVFHYAIERQELQESLRTLSFTDELTGLYNRRGFFTLFEQQYAYSLRMKKGFYIYVIDLDYLKHINDTYGHLMGDSALKETAACLKTSFRRYDILGRIGGDEFAVLAINASANSGKALKTHLLENLITFNQQKKYPFNLSLSIGMTYFGGEDHIAPDELLSRADKDLYEVKKSSHHKL